MKGGLPYVLYRNTVTKSVKNEETGLYHSSIKSELHFCHTCTTSHPEFKYGRTKDGDVTLQDGTTLLYTNRGFSPAPSQYYENRTEEQKAMWLKFQHENPSKLQEMSFGKINGKFVGREEGQEGPSSMMVQPGQGGSYTLSRCLHGSPICNKCLSGDDVFEGKCPFCGGDWNTRQERKSEHMARKELVCPICMKEEGGLPVKLDAVMTVMVTSVLGVPGSNTSAVVVSIPTTLT